MSDISGLITFSTGFGIVLGSLGRTGQVMTNFFFVFNEIIMRLVKIMMWYSPLGIMFLISDRILAVDDIVETIQLLGWYVATVLIGLGIHSIIILPLIYFAVTRKNPLTFCYGMLQAWVMALGTGSRYLHHSTIIRGFFIVVAVFIW